MRKFSTDPLTPSRSSGPHVSTPASADGNAVANENSETIKFAVHVDGTTVNCIASREFFEDRYGANGNPQSWIKAYQSNITQIHDLVVDRFKTSGHSLVLLMTEYV